MSGTSILVVDDDPAVRRILEYNLNEEGYTVYLANDGQQALRAVFEQRPDLVILDVMMPEMDGFVTCERIRELTDVPVIMLTALGNEEDVVRGLELGADDYVSKPFGVQEMLARVRATLRRAKLGPAREPTVNYQDDRLLIDLLSRTVRVNGERVPLSATEFNLLAMLVRHGGQVLEFNQILNEVWGPEYRDEVAYVRVYVSRLRQKIEPDPAQPIYIQTERQVGYRFVHKPGQ